MASGGARPGSGRKRKAPELKALAGTARPDRDGNKEISHPGAMVPPMHLGDLERLYFGSLALVLEQQGRASPHFVEHLALTATRLTQIQRWQAVLACAGDTYETATATGGVMIRKRPEVQMLSDAMRHAQSLLGELMLNPAAAMRLAESGKAEEDEFGEFFDK